uniref:Uncharacterized protein n=1 Tax=Nymphaea colorata TaxID=210225 RepID=A0A5K1EYB8_9MAGN|nr:unnamed protein product [Nymphaea colorata]
MSFKHALTLFRHRKYQTTAHRAARSATRWRGPAIKLPIMIENRKAQDLQACDGLLQIAAKFGLETFID